MARPSKFSEARAEAILTALRAGNTRNAAAGYAEVDHTTLANWMTRYSHFSQAVAKAEADAEVRFAATVAKAANEGDWRAAMAWLERRRNQEWGRKDRVEIINTVREWARLTGKDEEAAVAEAERFIRELRGNGTRR